MAPTVKSKKPSLGRKKIEIRKIHKKNHLQVTFSKRRTGLFKKASELCTLCGVEIAIVVFSPADKPFSFGHPDVEPIAQRFLSRMPPPPRPAGGAHQLIEAHRKANVHELNMQLTQITNQLDAEKKRGEMLSEMRKAGQRQCWWEAPIEQLGLLEAEQLREAMDELRKHVGKLKNKILVESSNALPFLAANNGLGMGTSSSYVESYERKPYEVHNFGFRHGIF